jgi:NADH-quinone oxidoreductase subunit G
MPVIYVENKPYEVKEGQNLLNACLSLGFDIPYFCWHPAMHSVGACRLCAVKQFKDEKDKKGKIVMSCMTLAAEGTRISIDDPEAVKFRKSVIEWLMINHPHDCPVCDEGGQCHLQDMTLMSGHIYRRYRFKKRTYVNQNLGPFVTHEMNRCIQCYRCVRFYNDYAGGRDLDVMYWHDSVYFGRHKDGTLESEFSGNLVEVCPTGVFTDKTLARHYTRKWDLQTAPSVCVHCGLGCNTIPGERYGGLRCIQNRFNSQVNGYFLCDRGRFGYEFVNSDKRIRQVTHNRKPISKKQMLDELMPFLNDHDKIIGIGSARASLESNFALRTLVGAEHFYSGVSQNEADLVNCILSIVRLGPARTASLHDADMSDAVLVLGEDVSNVAPMLGFALRQSTLRKPMAIAEKLNIERWQDAAVREALQKQTGPLFIATPVSTRIDDAATAAWRASPDDIARLGFAIAHELDLAAPAAEHLPPEAAELAKQIAAALKDAKRPLVVSGTSCFNKHIIEAAANVANATHSINESARLCFTVGSCNSIGLGLIGGNSISGALDALKKGSADTVVILENDLYRSFGTSIAEEIFSAAKNVIALDSLENKTTSKASFVLPAATFAESDGTLVNNEGRAQRYFKVFMPSKPIQSSWQWFSDIMSERWHSCDDFVKELSAILPIFDVAPSRDFRIDGAKIPRQPHRYSGRTSIYANLDVNEPMLPQDKDSPLAFSMEGFEGQPPPALICRFWTPKWNSVQSVNKYQNEVGGELRGGDPGKRLLEPQMNSLAPYFRQIPAAFEARDGWFLILPAYHVFGSEELSILSPGVAERAPSVYIVINTYDASHHSIREDDILEVNGYSLPVKISTSLGKGLAAVPFGLPDVHWPGEPFWWQLPDMEDRTQ